MVQVDWAQPALTDLREIHEFISRDSPRYAQLTVERITDAAAGLARFPQLGEVLPEFPRWADDSIRIKQLVIPTYVCILQKL